MLWLYVIFSNVVLVNLLIAMMGHTFETMIEEADLEWKFGRLQSIIECNDRFCAVPPPFNLPITLFAFLSFMYRKATTGTGEQSAKAKDEDQIADIKVANQKLDKVAKRLLYSLKTLQCSGKVIWIFLDAPQELCEQAPHIHIHDQNVDSNSLKSPGRKLRRNQVPHDELFTTPASNSWKSFSSPSQNGSSVISPSIAPQCRQVSNVSPKAEAPETQHIAPCALLHPSIGSRLGLA
jgi:hypothetical protein